MRGVCTCCVYVVCLRDLCFNQKTCLGWGKGGREGILCEERWCYHTSSQKVALIDNVLKES